VTQVRQRVTGGRRATPDPLNTRTTEIATPGGQSLATWSQLMWLHVFSPLDCFLMPVSHSWPRYSASSSWMIQGMESIRASRRPLAVLTAAPQGRALSSTIVSTMAGAVRVALLGSAGLSLGAHRFAWPGPVLRGLGR